MRFTFLLSSTSHVRFLKRIELLIKENVSVDVFAFKRKNTFPGKTVKFNINSMGVIEHNQYWKRIFQILKSIILVKKAVKSSDVVYTFGLDMLILGRISKTFSFNRKLKIVYEVGDIREILIGDRIKSKIARRIEKFFIKNVAVVVVTSEAFATEYFMKIQKIKNVKFHVIENKLDNAFMENSEIIKNDKKQENVLTIGYFGVLRCDRTWEILKTLARKGAGKVKINIRGIPGVKQKNQIERLDVFNEIEYGGKYVVPKDLPEMYGKVDLIWACYPFQGNKIGNWKWAKTIRFYESCYYNVPVLAQKGTEDCKTVEKYKIGACLDLNDIDGTVDYILNEVSNKRLLWHKNLENLPKDVFMYSNEHAGLKEILNSCC